MRCLLVGLLFLSSVIPVTVVDSRCSGNQITWIHKTSGRMIGCSPCPACPPGTEYSIPCSTKAVKGTPAKCVACPPGKFSTKFDKKPCISCTICSKRYTKKVCTPHGNAVCGGCLAGYHENEVTFSCDECERCCHDGKDQAPLGCARVGMCKTRPYGCPNPTTNSGTIKQSNVSQTLTSKIKQSHSRSVTEDRTSSSPTKQFLTKSFEHKTYFTSEAARGRSTMNDDITAASSQTIILYVVLSVLILIVLILLVAAVKFCKKNPRPDFARSLSSSYTTSPQFTPAPTPEDRTLEGFVENCHDVVESVCVLLFDKRRDGMWDFERVALRFGLNREERIAITQQASKDGGNPTRELLEVLCRSIRPKITVRQFAEIVKLAKRNDVYEKLVPFFSK